MLEAFGNAKTIRNNNSSRFGKWTALKFTSGGSIQGAFITPYLLEKSRVTFQARDERSYHSFYQLIAAARSRPQLVQELHLGNAEDYSYLSGSGVVEVNGIDDSADYSEVCDAFGTLGLTPDERDAVWRIVAAVLHLGNITFGEDAATDRQSEFADAGAAAPR